jgi:hypothetical protein
MVEDSSGLPYLQWIPFDAFSNITFIARGGFSKIFRANLKEFRLSGQQDIEVCLKDVGEQISAKDLNEV